MKINLCCGKDYRENYLNVDFSKVGSDGTSIKIDLNHDILTGLPWREASVEEVVFRESLEHFNRLQGYEVLKEIYRVLKTDGKLDLSVPNAVQQLKLLLASAARPTTLEEFLNPHNPPWGWWKRHEDLMGATHLHSKGDSHLVLHTKQSLSCILQAIGFKIDSLREGSSIYILARK